MTESCGYCRDLLNCPYRQTVNYLVAPPYTCPTCNGGFVDGESMQMIQGPWGCNQLVRNHYGGEFAVGNAWAGAMHVPQLWSSVRGGGFYGGDSRFSGPYNTYGPAITYGSQAVASSPVSVVTQQLIRSDPYMEGCYNDCCYDRYDGRRSSRYYGGGYGHSGGKRYQKHDYQYKYRRSTGDGPCSVM